MKKIKYLFIAISSIAVFVACSKQQAQITGNPGAQGPTGVPGGNVYGDPIPASLNAADFTGAGPIYWWHTVFSGYNPNIMYNLIVYGHKAMLPKEQFRLPWYNVYNAGDELLSSMNHDTINVWYVSASAAWPASSDSLVQLQLLILPQQNP